MRKDDIEAPEFYRPLEGARIFGLSRTQVYNAMKDGLLPYREFGRGRLIARTDLLALICDRPVIRRGRQTEAA